MQEDSDTTRERAIAARISSLIAGADVELDSVASRLTDLYRQRIPLYDSVAREEVERNTRIAAHSRHAVIDTGTDNPIREFAGIAGNCDLIITGDTLAMHIAIGLKIPVVVILGSTCPQEIELYSRGTKVISNFDCSPCYLSTCTKEVTCMDAISANDVFAAASPLLRSMKSQSRR